VIAVATLQEVSERRRELGIYAAMGASYYYIVALYLAKIVIIALSASALGFAIGSRLAVDLTSSFLVVNTQAVQTVWGDLFSVMRLATIVALLAMIPPMTALIRMDPNATLVEE
jgi:ABC-type antimicrobial peptide transport system permease subunit